MHALTSFGLVRARSRKTLAPLLRIAGHLMEVDVADLELEGGSAVVKGSPSQRIAVRDLARAAHLGHDLPDGVDPGLDATATLDPPDSSYPFATHAAVIDVDPETFAVRVLRYVVAHDSGVVVNPMLLEGQIAGGVAQGIAGALFENLVYDAAGQPLATTLMDYLVPTAMDLPDVAITLSETPAPDIPGGVKGGAEAGAVAPAAVLANAVADALADISHAVYRLPLEPARLSALARHPAPAIPRAG
jgi:carbon-monoxide dehydrogenase large subunit